MSKHGHMYYYNKVAILWSCGFHDCRHFQPKHLESLLYGKETICWNCKKETVISAGNMEMEKPTCPECRPRNLYDYLEFKGIK